LVRVLDSFLLQELVQFTSDAHWSRRIPEIGGTDLNCGCAGNEEFSRVQAVRDST